MVRIHLKENGFSEFSAIITQPELFKLALDTIMDTMKEARVEPTEYDLLIKYTKELGHTVNV